MMDGRMCNVTPYNHSIVTIPTVNNEVHPNLRVDYYSNKHVKIFLFCLSNQPSIVTYRFAVVTKEIDSNRIHKTPDTDFFWRRNVLTTFFAQEPNHQGS